VANVLLGATGSVAAVRVPLLVEHLTAGGHAVKVVATDAATYFFDPAPLHDILTLDADEWPGERYTRGDAVRHIELRRWADLLVIAPLDANTLAKLAVGLCDNALTCVWRAWDWAKPVVLAPAMNTLMWRHPFTRKHMKALAADFGAAHIPGHFDEETLIRQINDRAKTLRIVAPIEKELACGDIGSGAMAEVPDVVAAVDEMLTRRPA
jgi:phosphopantothenoylcysteine decarboxylase